MYAVGFFFLSSLLIYPTRAACLSLTALCFLVSYLPRAQDIAESLYIEPAPEFISVDFGGAGQAQADFNIYLT